VSDDIYTRKHAVIERQTQNHGPNHGAETGKLGAMGGIRATEMPRGKCVCLHFPGRAHRHHHQGAACEVGCSSAEKVISGAYSVCQKTMSICLLGAKTDSEQGS